jgi:monoterpene epsilon-lactone hydrolase
MSLAAHVLRPVMTRIFRPVLQVGVPLRLQRRRLELAARLIPPPRRVRVARGWLGGRPVVRCRPPDAVRGRAVLFIHGGAYGLGSIRTHLAVAGRLAVAARADVWLTDYRLAPEHPHPADVEDAIAAVRELRLRAPEVRLAVAGDSSGAGTAVHLVVALRDAGEALPTCVAMLSPWLDLCVAGHSYQANRDREVMADPEWLASMAAAYAGSVDPARISPLAQDLTAFPPTLVQVASDELFRSDADRFAELAAAAGVDCTADVWTGVWHNWHASGPLLPESTRALAAVGAFVARNDPGAPEVRR